MTARRIVCLMAIVFTCGSSLSADPTSGFETGNLAGWASAGPVAAVTEQYSRDFLGLAQPPVTGTWLAAEGNYFAALWSTDNADADAASLSASFDALAGDTLHFQYFFDFSDMAPYYDTAVGLLTWTGGSEILFEYNTPGYELADDENIGWTYVSYTLPITGAYTLQFSTQDGADSFESILGIDAVAVETIVPAPGAFVLGVIGIGLVNRLRRRRVV